MLPNIALIYASFVNVAILSFMSQWPQTAVYVQRTHFVTDFTIGTKSGVAKKQGGISTNTP